ncbi:MAG TPA: hypothetical protein VNJ01_00140 [Bacteriovoracaceae bacterium]|nr:hypothetical protein [Bacteriovoracaceae bacterium]
MSETVKMKIKIQTHLFLTSFLFFSACSSGNLNQPEKASRNLAANPQPGHQENTEEANKKIMSWYEPKVSGLKNWIKDRGNNGGVPDFIDFYLPEVSVVVKPSAEEALVAANTKKLYDKYFPKDDPSSLLGTFIESGHPYIETSRGPYQWDSMKVSGMEDPELFKKAVQGIVAKGIKSIRLGPNLHEVSTEPRSWRPFLNQIETIWLAGATPTVSVAFFPGLAKWELKRPNGSIIKSESYLLHRSWPKDMGKLTDVMMQELWKRASDVEAKLGKEVNVIINGVNEPETLAGFNRQFWHGAFAKWDSQDMMKYYIPSVIQIAKANVHIRLAAEKNSNGRRILFMHNEAMTPAYYPSHKGPGRFAVSKFMLGHLDLMNIDFEALLAGDLTATKSFLESKTQHSEVDWAITEFVFASWNKTHDDAEAARLKILKQFADLKSLHQELLATTGKTMMTDNMLHLDYYYQTEFIPNKPIDQVVDELSRNNGQKMREVLGAKDDKHFLSMLKHLVTSNDGDLKPKGAVAEFSSEEIEEIEFRSLLTKNDFIVLERLVGLRREYSFDEKEPFAARQKMLKLRPSETQLVRTDEILEGLTANDGVLLSELLGVKTKEEVMKILLEAAAKTSTFPSKNDSVSEILNANKRAVLHHILGMNRKFLLGFEPQHYATQVKLGMRYGFYTFFMEYVNALGLYTAGVGESGTPFFYFAPLLHDQVMIEYARALKNGVYGTQYSFGPAVDTRGWAKAPLGLHYEDDHEINPSGILSVVEVPFLSKQDRVKKESWADDFLKLFFSGFKDN